MESYSSGKRIPNPLCKHWGKKGIIHSKSLYLCFPQNPLCQWRSCKAHPTSFLLPVSFPLVPPESQVQSPAKPCAAVPLTVSSHSSPVHCVLPLCPSCPSVTQAVSHSGPLHLLFSLPGRLFPKWLQGSLPSPTSLLRCHITKSSLASPYGMLLPHYSLSPCPAFV